MIKIRAHSLTLEITQGNRTERRPVTYPVRIRVGDPVGENVTVTLRWSERIEAPCAVIRRAFKTGILAAVSVDEFEDGSRDGMTITVHTAGTDAAVKVTDVRPRTKTPVAPAAPESAPVSH